MTIHHSKVYKALDALGIGDHETVKTVLIGEHDVSIERGGNASEAIAIDWSPSIVGISGQEEQ